MSNTDNVFSAKPEVKVNPSTQKQHEAAKTILGIINNTGGIEVNTLLSEYEVSAVGLRWFDFIWFVFGKVYHMKLDGSLFLCSFYGNLNTHAQEWAVSLTLRRCGLLQWIDFIISLRRMLIWRALLPHFIWTPELSGKNRQSVEPSGAGLSFSSQLSVTNGSGAENPEKRRKGYSCGQKSVFEAHGWVTGACK